MIDTYPVINKKNFFKKILFIFRERGRKEKRGKRDIHVREKHQSVASCAPPTRDLACNPGMCLDHWSNW